MLASMASFRMSRAEAGSAPLSLAADPAPFLAAGLFTASSSRVLVRMVLEITSNGKMEKGSLRGRGQ